MRDQSSIPTGLCQCGCGERTNPASFTNPERGTVKGQPQRFIRQHQRRLSPVEYVVDPVTRCWVWQRGILPNGYGKIRFNQASHPAHRIVYERHRGPIPDGMTLDHLCHTADLSCPGGRCPHRRCVNPDHLEPVSVRENLLRGRSWSARNATKTACVHGHPFDEANTRIEPEKRDGVRRVCRACQRARTARYRARQFSR